MSSIVIDVENWNTSAIKYMAPKVGDKGGKSINIISKQTNRMLHLNTPLMMTWGISDFIDDKGESDNKYTISLAFPTEEYQNENTNMFLKKLKDFENQILDDAVKNSEIWWGEPMSREVCKHTFFPILKYSKNKDTKKIDYTKPPTFRAKVPLYQGKWGVEIYNTKQELIFPCDNPHVSPMDFVPKMSSVACGIQCGGIWIGGKGWGVTWKLYQCIVKPREVVSIQGKCHIKLSDTDRDSLENQVLPPKSEDVDVEEEYLPKPVLTRQSHYTESLPESSSQSVPPPQVKIPHFDEPPVKSVVNTHADDSDDDEHTAFSQESTPSLPASQVYEEPEPAMVVPVVSKKKIVKKKASSNV